MLTDLRHALRRLRRAPGFTLTVVLTLGLGIGATTAVFTLVDAVLLRPLDYPEPDRIVTLWSWSPQRADRFTLSGPDFRDLRDQSRSFSQLAKYRFGGTEGVVINGAAENIQTAAVSGDFFDVLGIKPRAGRSFSNDELKTGTTVVVGQALVRRHFEGDHRRALGATLKVFGRSLRIVGVMPPGFSFPRQTEIWLPVDTVIPEAVNRTAHNYSALGRLAPGISVAAAETELQSIAARLAAQYPDSNRNKSARLLPLREVLVGEYRPTLWLMMSAVGLVLIIACANTANLMLARGARRAQEIAVRTALGAGRGRIARQLFTESLVLAVLGGAVGLLAANWGLDALLVLAPRRIPGIEHMALDRSALLFTTAISLGVCLLIGLFPALQALRPDISAALRESGRQLAGTAGRLRGALVVAQLAISFVLLAGAGLLLQSLHRLASVDPGFRQENLLVMEANYPGLTEQDGQEALSFFDNLRDQAAGLPGVTAASYALTLPLDWAGSNGNYWIDAHPDPRATALFRAVGPDYFSLLGIPVVAGREIDRRDTLEAPRAVLINQAMARASWPDRDPVGERIRFGWMSSTSDWMTIVGVVADTRHALDQPAGQEVFIPAAQHPRTGLGLKLVVRTTGLPLAATLRQRARALNAEVPVVFTTAGMRVDQALSAPRFRTLLLALFAGAALLLALLGVAAVTAFTVAERHREIGLRLALGATPVHVLRQFVWRSTRLALLGLGLGAAAALASGQLLHGLLFGVSASDPRTLLAVGATLLVATAAAAAWPALTAARQSPMTALRVE